MRLAGVLVVGESGSLLCVGGATTRPEIVDQPGEFGHGFLSISKIFHLAHCPDAAVIRGCGVDSVNIKGERVLP